MGHSCLFMSFLVVYCLEKNKTQKVCDEAVDASLVALKLIPDWFVTSKMREKFDNTLNTNDDVLFLNEDFDKATIIVNQKHILAVDLEKINLNNNFDKDDFRLLTWRSKFEKRKALNKKGK